ncbi:hypothetical protein HF325_005276 [Metschnikowia pulcherrima]|uniref:Phosphodiesterase n=1 Tax=Metschnikowia pulcherrima TaxID=27326 RepID=A0A8H7GNT1_9ASCO|nr:hypothetical protein HF325_005276 [Metschnikowia pulcherrima]
MAEVFHISAEHTFHAPHAVRAAKTRHLTALAPLLRAFFKRGNDECDVSGATVVVLHPTERHSASENEAMFTELDSLSYDDKVLLLRYFFSHMNLIVVSTADLLDAGSVAELNTAIDKISALMKHRILRVATWTGTGININDAYLRAELHPVGEHVQISEIVATMSFLVHHHANMSRATHEQVVALKEVILRSLDFSLLLENHAPARLSQLCHVVGHWAFPAHALSNDDLVYCVYIMLEFALRHVRSQEVPPSFQFPSSNELFALVYMVRDTYKNGNSFHNFRHAVDVLQACFHFLVRLKCLPEFSQLELDPRAEAETVGKPENASKNNKTHKTRLECPLLSPLQSLGLLVAALGHDVGHPGVTNAFMIKYHSPTSQLFGERSVLELFHASVFVNKILEVNWPSLLKSETSYDSKASLLLKTLIINSILATDMAEHFEYISKLKGLSLSLAEQSNERVKLICSLLIKCADISNVTRPLRVLSQWALVLSQEFSEVETLENAIKRGDSLFGDVSYEPLPTNLDNILNMYPDLHKGQIFFIQTFAEGLFSSIVKHFPELQYTADLIEENNQFWLRRVEQLQKHDSEQ